MATAAHNKIDMKGGGICPFTGICSGNNNSEVVEGLPEKYLSYFAAKGIVNFPSVKVVT